MKNSMAKFNCLALCVVAVCFSSVYAEDGPANEDDILDIMFECAKEHGVKASELRAAARSYDVTLVNPCLWSCSFKNFGFLDDKGKYVLNPGLTYVKKILRDDEEYTMIENVAKQCESVNDKAGNDIPECEMGALVAACLLYEAQAQNVL